MKWEILAPDGVRAAREQEALVVEAGSSATVSQRAAVTSPVLWSPESPRLYKLVTVVESAGQVVDRQETEFGLRTVAFDANKGFLLNGKPYVLKGTCNHQDHAGVGAALPDRLQYFRVARLKEMGGNAYRTSHNPPTPELLGGLRPAGHARDGRKPAAGQRRPEPGAARTPDPPRPQPCERRDLVHCQRGIHVQATPAGGRVARDHAAAGPAARPHPARHLCRATSGNEFDGINAVIEVRGWNYHVGKDMDDYHAAHPAQPNVGTRAGQHGLHARHLRQRQRARLRQRLRRQRAALGAHRRDLVEVLRARPWLSGGFAWTGFDYRGEPTPYAWPCINSHFGILDTCGFPKDNFYYYQAWWSDQHRWSTCCRIGTGPAKKARKLTCAASATATRWSCSSTGKAWASRPCRPNSHTAWKVKYRPGALAAKAYRGRTGCRRGQSGDHRRAGGPQADPAAAHPQRRWRGSGIITRRGDGRARPGRAGGRQPGQVRIERPGENPGRRQRRPELPRAGRVPDRAQPPSGSPERLADEAGAGHEERAGNRGGFCGPRLAEGGGEQR